MRVRYLRPFDSACAALHRQDRAAVDSAVWRLLDYFSGGPKPLGLGLRKLQGRFWEVRAGLDTRVLFKLEGDLVTFVLVGNHDEMRRFLRHNL
jgi:hypothetical protein